MMPDRRSSNGYGLVVLLAGAALVLVSLQLVGCGSPDRPQETQRGASATPDSFSRSDWLAHPDSRHQLAEDLLAAGTLTAMSRDGALRLLGDPSDTQSRADFLQGDSPREQRQYLGLTDSAALPVTLDFYCLGPERGFISVDDEWLVISYSNHDRVAGGVIRSD